MPAKSTGVLKPPLPVPPKKPPATAKKPRFPSPQPPKAIYEELDSSQFLPPTTYELTTIRSSANEVPKKAIAPIVDSPKTSDDAQGQSTVNQQIQVLHDKVLKMEQQIQNILESQSYLEDEIRMLKLSEKQPTNGLSKFINRDMSPQQVTTYEILYCMFCSVYMS